MNLKTSVEIKRTEIVLNILSGISTNFITGSFKLSADVIVHAPQSVRNELQNFENWSVFVFAIPINDQVLWIWHKKDNERFLFANYLLTSVAKSLQLKLKDFKIDSIDVAEKFGSEIAMVELGERAGMGTRGINNLLLHPIYGSWLQIHALFIDAELKYDLPLDFSVCTKCDNCVAACPAHALDDGRFQARRCSVLVAAPWIAKSKAIAVTSESYIECAECISSCPIGQSPEGIFEWKQ